MSNKIIADSFETLSGGAKAVAGQATQIVKQIGEDAAESIGLKSADSAGTSEQGGQQKSQIQDDQTKKKEAQKNSLVRKRYKELQEEIKNLQIKRKQETVKYNQPGFTDEEKQQRQIKQLEEKSSPTGATDDKLPPLPVQRAQRKTEKLRGVSG